MFITTPHHKLILSVLEKTGILSFGNMETLLAAEGAEVGAGYVERLAAQLAHMQKAYPATEGLITAPRLVSAPPGADMLAAVDIMLDVSGGRPLALRPGAPPCKLCFLVETEYGIGGYAVISVEARRETALNFILEGMDEKRVIILLLENENQKERLKIGLPHFFAVREKGKIRYFEGVPAK
jgi:hypothetical protein